MGRKEIIRFW